VGSRQSHWYNHIFRFCKLTIKSWGSYIAIRKYKRVKQEAVDMMEKSPSQNCIDASLEKLNKKVNSDALKSPIINMVRVFLICTAAAWTRLDHLFLGVPKFVRISMTVLFVLIPIYARSVYYPGGKVKASPSIIILGSFTVEGSSSTNDDSPHAISVV
jgi:hypothetical protein